MKNCTHLLSFAVYKKLEAPFVGICNNSFAWVSTLTPMEPEVEAILALAGHGSRAMPLAHGSTRPGRMWTLLPGAKCCGPIPGSGRIRRRRLAGLYLYFCAYDQAHGDQLRTIGSAEGSFWLASCTGRSLIPAMPGIGSGAEFGRTRDLSCICARRRLESWEYGVKNEWDPFAFIDYCESARRKPGSRRSRRLLWLVQLAEWQLLFDLLREASPDECSRGCDAGVRTAAGDSRLSGAQSRSRRGGGAGRRWRVSAGTDVHLWLGQLPIPKPVILGHETVGVVDQLGAGLEKDWRGEPLKVGDRVCWASSIACGECFYCRLKAQPTRCLTRKAYGISYNADDAPHLRGGYAEKIHLRAGTALFRLPDSLPTEAVVGAGAR